jgi:hypothetical protein
MYGVNNTIKEKINEVVDNIYNKDTVCYCIRFSLYFEFFSSEIRSVF